MVDKECRCGPSWLSANDCVCKSVPKAKQHRRVTGRTRKAERSRADDHPGENEKSRQQTIYGGFFVRTKSTGRLVFLEDEEATGPAFRHGRY